MSKIEIPEEIVNEWREEFENFIKSDSKNSTSFERNTDGSYAQTLLDTAWYGFLAAKSSSYEREQFLVQQRDLISDATNRVGETNQKLQQRILELEKSIEGNPALRPSERFLMNKIAKRDELIEEFYYLVDFAENRVKGEPEWSQLKDRVFKEVKELKGEK